MIIWLFFFLVIIIVSFILAYNSMKDFAEIPSSGSFSVYLIRNIAALNTNLFDTLYKTSLKNGDSYSIERIFKGGKTAYIFVGPKDLAVTLPELNLLELEDYATESEGMILWEMTFKDLAKLYSNPEILANFSQNLPILSGEEQLWFQFILKGEKGKHGEKSRFHSEIRVCLMASESRAKELVESLTHLAGENLVKLPLPIGSKEMYELYKNRGLYRQNKHKLFLAGDEIVNLLKS